MWESLGHGKRFVTDSTNVHVSAAIRFQLSILFITEVEAVEVVELPGTVVTPEEKHHVFINRGRGTVPTFWPYTVSPVGLHVNLAPLACRKIKSVKVIPVMTVVATEDIHAIFIHDSGM